MRKLLLSFFLFFIITSVITAQTGQDESSKFRFEFLPKGLHFIPLRANIDEAKMGVLMYPKDWHLKVDIGNSIDILKFSFPGNEISIGAEFMAFAYVTSYQEFRLQIDELDGFFGGNLTYTKNISNGELFSRFRIIHNSSHLADGHWDWYTHAWKDNKIPYAFGRDYAEIAVGHILPTENYLFRYYGSTSYAFHQNAGGKPLKKSMFGMGVEISSPNYIGKVFNNDTNIFFAGHINFEGIPKYVGDQNYMLGLKFGDWNGKGILIYGSYYTGGDLFNQYFTDRVHRFGFGFAFEFI
jgi:hypothetical protein